MYASAVAPVSMRMLVSLMRQVHCLVAAYASACYGERRVTLLRPRSLYRVAALLLLFMTGLDLSMDIGNVTFCAIDAERSQASAGR